MANLNLVKPVGFGSRKLVGAPPALRLLIRHGPAAQRWRTTDATSGVRLRSPMRRAANDQPAIR
jgi:hypothetical protein